MPQPVQHYRSYWLDEAIEQTGFQPKAPLRGYIRADVAIVGGGFCGMWAAYELKRRHPGLDVVILERDICGSGASSANGGFLIGTWAKLLSLEKFAGINEAIRVCVAAGDCVEEVAAFIEDHDIDADFHRNGWLWGATCEAQMNGWEPIMQALAKTNHMPFELVGRERLHADWGLSGMLGGAMDRSAPTLQPAKLALGLRRALLAMGVRIYEQTPMTSIRRGKTVDVITEGGEVAASKILLAINAWSVRFAPIRRQVAVVASEAAVTTVDPEWIAKMGWSNLPGSNDSRGRLIHFRTTKDGRVEFGKAGANLGFGAHVGPQFHGVPSQGIERTRSELARIAPATAQLKLHKSWIAPIDKSSDGFPVFSHLGDKRIVYAAGFTGHGLSPTKLASKILASLLLDTKDEWTSLPFVRPSAPHYPREPIKYVGGTLVRRAIDRTDQYEHQNRRPPFVTRFLATQTGAAVIPSGKSR
jgi:glycine/D-amino acid oxidase-like deaminating enzyme